MCSNTCLDFIKQNIRSREAKGKKVLECGARNVNGSARDIVEALKPYSYVGTDIVAGPCVDEICDASELVTTFGADNFDLVITTEMLEHVRDWRAVVSNLKRVLKPGGILYVTTRSKGFPFHEYPEDHWRYEVADMQTIFADFDILVLESDPREPGVFLKARKPDEFVEADLSEYQVQDTEGNRAEVAQTADQTSPLAPTTPMQQHDAPPPPPGVALPSVVQPLPANYRRLPWDRRVKR